VFRTWMCGQTLLFIVIANGAIVKALEEQEAQLMLTNLCTTDEDGNASGRMATASGVARL